MEFLIVLLCFSGMGLIGYLLYINFIADYFKKDKADKIEMAVKQPEPVRRTLSSLLEDLEDEVEKAEEEVEEMEKGPVRKSYHVLPNSGRGWVVKEAKAKRPSGKFTKKTDAVAKAKELAKMKKLGQVIVHKKDGTIQKEYTYGNDPKKSKG